MNRWFRSILTLSVFLVTTVYAQQTGFSGRVTDPQGAAVVGASVDITQAGGASFHAVTNGEGTYLAPSLAAADYEITVSAAGFTAVKKSVALLVGQLASVDFSLPLASTNTLVVVEDEAVPIDTTSSVVAGNVTPQEVQGLPINGRNYMQFATLVPGVKINAITSDVPVGTASETGKFQITLDGLQISQDTAGSSFGQPRFSQDAISQFQIITNRFDATSGRSAGVYVNSQTKSGSDSFHGGAFGYFRNDEFNAADPVAKTVLPFQDTQYGGTLGGPIKREKLWFFGSYEGESQPYTATSTPLVTGKPFSRASKFGLNEYLGRIDWQMSEKDRLLVRGDGFTYNNNYQGVSGTIDPSRASQGTRTSYGYTADWNRAISSSLVNDVRAGFHRFGWQNLPYIDSIELIFPGSVSVGGDYRYPQIFGQNTQQYRDDVFWLKGKHAIKVGGEFLYTHHGGYFQQYVRGSANCSHSGPAATPATYATFFPNGTTDPSTWNLTAIQSFCNTGITYTQGFGNFTVNVPRSIIGLWVQDDWKLFPRFTVNLGLRYDNDLGAFTGGPKLSNGLLTPKGNDNNNVAPRLGFAWDIAGDGKTSVRGGAGLYFADINANAVIDQQIFNGVSTIQASTSGTNVDLSDPFNGGNPATNPAAYPQQVQPLAKDDKVPYSLQISFGLQRQLPWRTVLSADLVHNRVYNDWIRLQGNLLQDPTNTQRNLNPSSTLTPTLGANRICGNGSVMLDTIPSYTSSTRQVCNQSFTNVLQFFTPRGAGSIYDGLQIGVRHSTTAGFTSGLAYTWSRTKNSTDGPFNYPNKPFLSGISREWANATDDQRHSLTLNGEYKWRYGLSLSALYRFGSGMAYNATSGTTVNGYTSGTRTFASQPINPGQICPATACTTIYAPVSKTYFDTGYGYWILQRGAFRGRQYHRLDSRLQEVFPIKEKYKVTLAVEAFNLFNHPNYGAYNTVANTAAYGNPASVSGNPVEYAGRQLQFIGRFSF